jgi:aspartyl-tRNA(Asn)/glutamyl-tRNA(Gln) amidotransferase subunit C
MSIDIETVQRVARLARIKVSEEEADALKMELNAILGWVDELQEVEVEGVEPMTSVVPMRLKQRSDEVTEGGRADDILANAPACEDRYFVVPKVVE